VADRGQRVIVESERSVRRLQSRRRVRRQRWIALGAALVFILAGVASVLVVRGQGSPSAVESSRVLDTSYESSATVTVTGSSANEAPPTAPTRQGGGGAEPARTLRGKTIVIDPGHNRNNFAHSAEINRLVDAGTLKKPCDTTGAETNSGYTEAAYNLDVALRLRQLLRRAGARVILTRATNDGWGPCITERAAIGNRAHASAAISIHADGGPSSGRGFHVIYPPSIKGLTDDISASSKWLALAVRAAFKRGTELPYATYIGRDGLDVRSDLGGLNLSDVPKVFIETGNMRNAIDAKLLVTPSFRQREAQSLAHGIGAFLTGK
jgi:N-acetylmuramoyl-L-alanine amidase